MSRYMLTIGGIQVGIDNPADVVALLHAGNAIPTQRAVVASRPSGWNTTNTKNKKRTSSQALALLERLASNGTPVNSRTLSRHLGLKAPKALAGIAGGLYTRLKALNIDKSDVVARETSGGIHYWAGGKAIEQAITLLKELVAKEARERNANDGETKAGR